VTGRTVIYIIILLVYSIFAIGCTMRTNKIYDYKQAIAKYEGGNVRARLIGTFISMKKETIKGSPYELFFLFEASSKVTGSVSVIDIELHDALKKEIVFKGHDILRSDFKLSSDGSTYRAYFSVKDLDLKYVRYMLILKFKINTDKTVLEKEIKLYFDKDYKEDRSNDFWDRLMSV